MHIVSIWASSLIFLLFLNTNCEWKKLKKKKTVFLISSSFRPKNSNLFNFNCFASHGLLETLACWWNQAVGEKCWRRVSWMKKTFQYVKLMEVYCLDWSHVHQCPSIISLNCFESINIRPYQFIWTLANWIELIQFGQFDPCVYYEEQMAFWHVKVSSVTCHLLLTCHRKPHKYAMSTVRQHRSCHDLFQLNFILKHHQAWYFSRTTRLLNTTICLTEMYETAQPKINTLARVISTIALFV